MPATAPSRSTAAACGSSPCGSARRPIGLLAAAGRAVEPGTLDTLAGLAAIAIERAQLLSDRQAGEMARQSDQLKSALLASISHDLRTPLTAIRVAASNVDAPELAPAERAEQRDVILAEVERLTRLFENLLEMARIDAGSLERTARWTHPSEIVSAARAQVDHVLAGRDVVLRLEPDEPVRLDPRLTAAALAHLLENAAQYTAPGSSIEVHAQTGPDGFRLAVRDHGTGIDIADLPHLFDRFYRGANAKGRASGTGMGLWHRARAGGRRRRPGLGRERARGWRHLHHRDARRGARGGRAARPLMVASARILLVDDEAAIQRAVAPLLRARGYEVEVAGTGARGAAGGD